MLANIGWRVRVIPTLESSANDDDTFCPNLAKLWSLPGLKTVMYVSINSFAVEPLNEWWAAAHTDDARMQLNTGGALWSSFLKDDDNFTPEVLVLHANEDAKLANDLDAAGCLINVRNLCMCKQSFERPPALVHWAELTGCMFCGQAMTQSTCVFSTYVPAIQAYMMIRSTYVCTQLFNQHICMHQQFRHKQ
jgi:hypothetical protein